MAGAPSIKAMQALRSPFADVPEDLLQKTPKASNPRDFFRNQLQTESALYFDARTS